MNNEPDDITCVIILDRGMNIEVCKTMFPPDPPTGKIQIQGDLRDLHPIQGGAGGQDQAVELQY